MNNEKVIECFIGKVNAKSWNKNLTTDGISLFSYEEKIAEHYKDKIYVFNKARFLKGGFFSMTTSHHISKTLYVCNYMNKQHHILSEYDYEKIKVSQLEDYLIDDLADIVLSYLTIKY